MGIEELQAFPQARAHLFLDAIAIVPLTKEDTHIHWPHRQPHGAGAGGVEILGGAGHFMDH